MRQQRRSSSSAHVKHGAGRRLERKLGLELECVAFHSLLSTN